MSIATQAREVSRRPVLAEPARRARVRDILFPTFFPTDRSPATDHAFEHAALLAERLGARVTLYHVVPPVAGGHAVRDARERLQGGLASVRATCEVLVEEDASVERALLRALRVLQPDLAVMSTHGRPWLAQLFRASLAERALDFGGAPLMLVREADHGVALPYRRILVPTDLSPASARAFPLAALLARSFGAEVVLLHVAATPHGDAAFGTFGVTYDVQANLPSEDALVEFFGSECNDVKLLPQVLTGCSWDRILETARTQRADLIVMSTHGRDSVADAMLGSHAERIVRHAPCPVLVV